MYSAGMNHVIEVFGEWDWLDASGAVLESGKGGPMPKPNAGEHVVLRGAVIVR